MSEKNKVIKASLGYIIGNYLIKGLTFLSIPIFARLMETNDYGIYNNFIAYEGILFVLIGWAIHSSYKNAKLKFEKQSVEYNYENYVSDTVVLVFFTAIVYSIIVNLVTLVSPSILHFNFIDANLLVIYSFSTAIIVCFNTDVGIRYEYNKFLTVAGINAVSNVSLSIILMLTFFKYQRYEGRILGTALPAFILSLVIIFIFFKRKKPAINKKELSWGVKYSMPIIPHGISQIILSQFDRIMITQMIGDHENGIYSFAANISLILTVTSQSLDTVWGQWFYDNRKVNRLDRIKKYSSIYMLLMLAFTISLMLVVPEAVNLIGSSKYNDSVVCVYPILAGAYFTYLYTIPSTVEYFHEKTKKIAVATSVAAILNIILNYIFISIYGYVAAAYTTLITYILYYIFHCIMAFRIEKKNIFSIKTSIFCSVSIIFFTFASLFLINYVLLRWIFAIIILFVSIVWEEKKIGASKVFLSKIIKKGK